MGSGLLTVLFPEPGSAYARSSYKAPFFPQHSRPRVMQKNLEEAHREFGFMVHFQGPNSAAYDFLSRRNKKHNSVATSQFIPASSAFSINTVLIFKELGEDGYG